jgi:hypothetical protein
MLRLAPPMSGLKLAFGAAALFSMMLIAASERGPRPPQAVADPITERWLPEPGALPKADRLPLPVPEFVAEGPPAPAAADGPPPAFIRPAVETDRRPHRIPARDVCSRHGMRKVVTRGGKSWRCRRTS